MLPNGRILTSHSASGRYAKADSTETIFSLSMIARLFAIELCNDRDVSRFGVTVILFPLTRRTAYVLRSIGDLHRSATFHRVPHLWQRSCQSLVQPRPQKRSSLGRL